MFVRDRVRPATVWASYLPLVQGLVGKSAWNSMEFHDYFNPGPFELLNFCRNLIFPIVKCVPANL